MPFDLPQSSNRYEPPPGLRLTRATWRAVFSSIGERLDLLEAQRAEYQAIIDAGVTQGLAVIANTIEPTLDAAADQVAALDAAVTAAEDRLEAVDNAIAELIAGGVSADNVSLEAISGLTATDAQAALAELLLAIEANATAIGTKANAADVYTTSQVYTKSEVDTAIASSGTSIATLMAFS